MKERTPTGWRREWRDVDGWENKMSVYTCPHCGWYCMEDVSDVFTFCPICGERVIEEGGSCGAGAPNQTTMV